MSKAVKVNDKLTKRLLVYILLCSTLVSVFSTIVQLYSSFQYDVELLEQRFNNIEKSYIPSLATSLWDFNEPLVAQQVQGIVDLPDIGLVIVKNDFDYLYEQGSGDFTVKKLLNIQLILKVNM